MLKRISGLSIDDGGSGDPVVLVHSLAGNTTQWSGQLDPLRAQHQVVAFDLRGHGRSDPAKSGGYSIAAHAEDLAAVVDGLGLGRFALVGHSFGAGVALAYAGAHPERVSHLLLADSIGDGTQTPQAEVGPFLAAIDSPEYVETIEGYWSSIAGSNGAVLERLLRDLRATPREVVVQGLNAVVAFDPKPALARYRGPMLAVITAANDFSYSLHRLGSGMPHRVISDTGHWLQIERPVEFNRIVERFLMGEA